MLLSVFLLHRAVMRIQLRGIVQLPCCSNRPVTSGRTIFIPFTFQIQCSCALKFNESVKWQWQWKKSSSAMVICETLFFENIFNTALKSRVPDGEFPLRQYTPMKWHELKWKVKEREKRRIKYSFLKSEKCFLHFVLYVSQRDVQSPAQRGDKVKTKMRLTQRAYVPQLWCDNITANNKECELTRAKTDKYHPCSS